MSRSLVRRPGLALAALLITACSDASGPDGSTRVSVLLTDAPGDVHAAVVTISEVYLLAGSERVSLLGAPVTVDLTELVNTTTELVADVAIEPGEFDELRFVITGGYVEAENLDGSTSIYASAPDYGGLPEGATVQGTLQMPSLAASGLKVSFDSDLVVDGETTLLVDFDVSQSFGQQAGQSGLWVMHPVITGATLEAAATVTATLTLASGVALPPVSGTTLSLSAFRAVLGSDELFFEDANSDGVFTATFAHVLPGTYSLSVSPPLGVGITTLPAHPTTIDVAAAASPTVAFAIQGVTDIP